MLTEQDTFFESLYQSNVKRLMMYAKVRLGNWSMAEEAVQDTFYTAVLQKEKIQQHSNPEAFLMSTLKFKICESRRERRRRLAFFLSLDSELPASVQAPDLSIPTSTSSIMLAVSNALSQEEREFIDRLVFQGASHLDMARELGISVWASQKRLERIRKKLRDACPEYLE